MRVGCWGFLGCFFFWQHKSNPVLVSIGALSMQRLPVPTGLCKGQPLPSWESNTAPACASWGSAGGLLLRKEPHHPAQPLSTYGGRVSSKKCLLFQKGSDPFSLECWEIETSSLVRKKCPLFAVKGKCHLSCTASGVRECVTVAGLKGCFFCKGRKDKGMQGLNGRGSLSFLGHEFDSS